MCLPLKVSWTWKIFNMKNITDQELKGKISQNLIAFLVFFKFLIN